jgi:phosphoribosylaminoimidazole-succinocarboxamide synthase
MRNTITSTNFKFPGQESVYKGKVREVYTLENNLLVMVATDRLSAFDVVMPKGIPFKGQILNQIATKMMRATEDIVPNWLIATPDPNVAVGLSCQPFKVEMVVRGYLAGHAAREYASGKRQLCGVPLPEGMRENDKFPDPIITPATKAVKGDHDEDISMRPRPTRPATSSTRATRPASTRGFRSRGGRRTTCSTCSTSGRTMRSPSAK